MFWVVLLDLHLNWWWPSNFEHFKWHFKVVEDWNIFSQRFMGLRRYVAWVTACTSVSQQINLCEISTGGMGCGDGGGVAGQHPPCWQKANQVSALIWVSVLSSGEPQGIQLLSYHPIHVQSDSAECSACECAREHAFYLFIYLLHLSWSG